jgi:hypothetical protein
MEVDAFHDGHGIAVEVEAGRAWKGNAVYRDIVRTSLPLDARYMALLVPLAYTPPSVKRAIPAYEIHQSATRRHIRGQRLVLPSDGVLLPPQEVFNCSVRLSVNC